jgi:S-adenosylmethionine:tRNA ribosyltransferase-isomerase
MRLSDFDYELPEDLIAQEPPAERDGARMLVLHRDTQTWEDRTFRDLPEYLRPGDCLVLNDSRVLPSRLFGAGNVEAMLIEPLTADAREWRALVRPGRKIPVGRVIQFDDRSSAEVIARGERGERTLRFLGAEDVYAALDRIGHMPLPPYIKREDKSEDRDRYQTVYARERGSTGEVLDRAQAAGAKIARVTLHVGLGTFQPIEREDFENHALHYERYSIPEDSRREIETAARVVAVGTTSVRTVESGGRAGSTNLFIYPGYQFHRVGAMLTNFHLSAPAGLLTRGNRLRSRGLPPRRRRTLSVLLLWGLHDDPVICETRPARHTNEFDARRGSVPEHPTA